MRSTQVFFAFAPRSESSLEVISGVSVSETIPLAKMEITMVIENSRKMRPTRPPMNTRGINTAASESVMVRIVKLISFAEFEEASSADRKSTRLNSSHGYISYAVFCLKKKNYVLDKVT